MRIIFLLGIFIAQCSNIFSQALYSELNTGTWYKVAVVADGIYKITYQDLVTLGVPVASLDPRHFRLFGNGGGMLPTKNDIPRPLDLNEITIKIIGESDGVFNTQDYILFYGQSQHRWKYDSLAQRFRHTTNVYSDTTFYFLNTDYVGAGARITGESSVTQTANHTITSFDHIQFHELDSVNLLHGGREWYGEQFSTSSPQRDFVFTIPDLDLNEPVEVYSELIGRSFTTELLYQITTSGGMESVLIPVTNSSITADYAKTSRDTVEFLSPSNTFTVSINFLGVDTSDRGWLNWMEIYARRNLTMSGTSLFFRDLNSVGAGNISEFNVNGGANDSVWDVTNHNFIKEILSVPGSSARRIHTDDLRELVCFNESALSSPVLIGPVPNQSLRGSPVPDMVIITPSEFLSAANDLAAHHSSYDGLSVKVVELNQIYNEFSSGSQDLTAIHDFISYMFHRSGTFKYVLLLGDASYDYKNRIPGNTNFVPCFETSFSLNLTTCYSSDEYIGYMDSTEGESDFSFASVDLAIGRLPARNLSEANLMVNKTIHYASNSIIGDWRKQYILCADDEDNNTHLSQAEALAEILDTVYCQFDLEKIYIDAFQQDTVPYGWRYPDVTTLLQKRFDDGFLYFNYTGHTGENWIANERIIDSTFIDNLQNQDHLPFISVFGLEFNSYDDPGISSGGEQLMLNPSGGAIGCFSGTNLCFSGSNFSLSQKFHKYILEADSGWRMGDVCMKAKHEYNDRYTRNYVLLGDPAVRLKYPENKIVLTTFNTYPVSGTIDTLPLGTVLSATGEVQNPQGQLMPSFSGYMKVLMLRVMPDTTLANDNFSFAHEFDTWNDTLYDGTFYVSSGIFNFSFIIPTNVSQFYHPAKLSLYADDGTTDATGCYDKMLVGNIFYSVNELEGLENAFTISPNPATSEVEIKLLAHHDYPMQFSLFDPEGRKIMSIGNIQQDAFRFNCGNFARGIYFVTVENNDGKTIGREKLIIR